MRGALILFRMHLSESMRGAREFRRQARGRNGYVPPGESLLIRERSATIRVLASWDTEWPSMARHVCTCPREIVSEALGPWQRQLRAELMNYRRAR